MGKGLLKRGGDQIEIIPTKVATDGIEEFKDGEDEGERKAIRERTGLTYEELCKTVRAGIVAELYDGESGKPLKGKPAHATRAKFIAVAADIIGAKKSEAGAQKCPSIIIILPDGRRI